MSLKVTADLHDQKHDARLHSISSGDIVQANRAIKFRLSQADDFPVPRHENRVKWQVVNTGQEAKNNKDLQDGFYPSGGYCFLWERTSHRNVH